MEYESILPVKIKLFKTVCGKIKFISLNTLQSEPVKSRVFPCPASNESEGVKWRRTVPPAGALPKLQDGNYPCTLKVK